MAVFAFLRLFIGLCCQSWPLLSRSMPLAPFADMPAHFAMYARQASLTIIQGSV